MIKIIKKTITNKAGKEFYCIEVVWMGGQKLVFIDQEIWETLPREIYPDTKKK